MVLDTSSPLNDSILIHSIESLWWKSQKEKKIAAESEAELVIENADGYSCTP